MAFKRSRCSGLVVVALLLLHPGKAVACFTDCVLTSAFGDCLTCGFRAVSEVTCHRSSCDSCDTLDCGEALPPQATPRNSGLISSASCAAPSIPISVVKIVRVQRPVARG
jgi:hypothetical protein